MYYISAFYHFAPLTNLEEIKASLEAKAEELNVKGLLILGPEGINTTCSAKSKENLEAFKKWIIEKFNCPKVQFKDSECEHPPFRRYKVKIRDEIVTTGIPGVLPPEGKNHHLSPEEWTRVMTEENDYVIIDTRNWYEYQMGTFKGALNPNIEKFTEFPEYIEKQGIPKDKKMLIFCTGGIRCEKGILELQNQGYDHVFQLEGGILNYFAQYPEGHPQGQYEGECFVFDHRVAVDQNLKPSQVYKLCPHCGQPAKTEIRCKRCDHHEKVCEQCLSLEFKKDTCSKNCAYQWERNPGKKGKHQVVPFELENEVELGNISPNEAVIRVSKRRLVKVNEKGEAKTITTS